MSHALTLETGSEVFYDRPGWIPPEITHGWDTCPYAYQTEEELMPAGGTHGDVLPYIKELLRAILEKRKLRLLMDVFMLYRDELGVKRRVSPDLLLMPWRSSPPSAYDLDVEPPPLCVAEVTSPKSRKQDLGDKVSFYEQWDIPTYLVIDVITSTGKLRKQIGLHVWRRIGGRLRKMRADTEGALALPEMKLKILAHGQQLYFVDPVTRKTLFDAKQWQECFQEQAQQTKAAKQQAKAAKQQAKAEAQRADSAEQQTEAAKQQAKAEAQRAASAEQRAEAADAEIARLKALLANTISK
ncbi:MAG: Uma2 family endonuclease [Gammaproteobacteria bacterium]|nr:Uma2 family endonuclease [Gammaproteobacteria bacterium]